VVKARWPGCSEMTSGRSPGCDAHRVPAGGVHGRRGRDDPQQRAKAAQRVVVCSTGSIGPGVLRLQGTTRLASVRCWRP
jgi:hypothetical protein